MIVSEKTLKWVMRLYPPLFFQRIWVQKFGKGFRSVSVKINKSLWNKNYNGSIFGGTIFAAADPFYAILFDQMLQRKGYKVRVWLKSGNVQYLKPARTHLYFSINISDEELEEAEQALDSEGKFVKSYPIEIFNKDGLLCATLINEVYIRNLHPGEPSSLGY